MIGIALVAATVLSFVWILLMRFLTGLMVWLSVALIFVLVGGLFGYCVFRYTFYNTIYGVKWRFKIKCSPSISGLIYFETFLSDIL